MRAGLSIRQKLLFVLTGLLLLSGVLSLVLHLREVRRTEDEVRAAVDRIVENLVREGLIAGGGPESGGTAFREDFGAGVVREPRGSERAFRIVRPAVRYDSGVWAIVIESRALEETLLSEDGVDPVGVGVLPGSGEDGAPTVDRTIDSLRDPIELAGQDLGAGELAIAGSVLLVGFVATWFIAGRLSRPLRELTRQMEAVARGDLDVVSSSPAREPRRRDEVAQMSAAFVAMVESLREKREIEQRMFRSERLAALGNLAAGVAHDVRNPLNTIGLSLAHIRDAYAPLDESDRRGFERTLDDVHGELARLEELVRNFLALADSGRTAGRGAGRGGDLGDHEPRAIVEDCLRLFRKEAESKGVEIDARLADVGALAVDAAELRRAIANVLLNALQAIEDAEDRAGAGRIEVVLAGDDREVALRVADSGRGMTPEEVESALLPYYSTRDEGTGLGLPIARGVVDAHGGQLTVHSRPGAGTEVEIVLPRTEVCS